jgi:hypothetical protein
MASLRGVALRGLSGRRSFVRLVEYEPEVPLPNSYFSTMMALARKYFKLFHFVASASGNQRWLKSFPADLQIKPIPL